MLLLLGVLALAKLAQDWVALFNPLQVDYGESFVYAAAARVARGEVLYQPLVEDGFLFPANYTPVYYLVTALLQAVLGPGLIWGRATSLVATLVSSACVGMIAGRRAKSWLISCLAVVFFIALGFIGTVPWAAIYRVDMLGVAFSVSTVFVLDGRLSARRVILAGVLAAAAVLTKQTLIAPTLAGLVWLATLRAWRLAALFAGAAIGGTVLVWGIAQLMMPAFTEDVIGTNLNEFRLDLLIGRGLVVLFTQLVPIVLGASYVLATRAWARSSDRLLILYWLAAAIPVLGIGKAGASTNYSLEFAAAGAILGALGAWYATRCVSRLASLGLGFGMAYAVLTISAGTLQATWASTLELHNTTEQNAGEFRQLVDRVRREPRLVLAEPADVVTLAGKPVLLEPLLASFFLDAGQYDPGPLVQRICRGDVGLAVLARPMDLQVDQTYDGHRVWPLPILQALMQTMQLDGMQAGRAVYVQHQPLPTCAPIQASGALRR